MSTDTDPSDKSLADIWKLLHEINLKLETHIVEEDTYKPKLIQAIQILEQSKGVVTFIKFCIWTSGLIWAISIWVRDHFKW